MMPDEMLAYVEGRLKEQPKPTPAPEDDTLVPPAFLKRPKPAPWVPKPKT